MKRLFITFLAIAVIIFPACHVSAGSYDYLDHGIKSGDLGMVSEISILVTGAAGDAAAGGALVDHTIQYMQPLIDAGAQLMEVELVRGVGAKKPSAVNVSISNAATGGTIIWGPKAITTTLPDADPGTLYGGHDKWGVLPIASQWYLTVGVLGTGDTVTIIMRFK